MRARGRAARRTGLPVHPNRRAPRAPAPAFRSTRILPRARRAPASRPPRRSRRRLRVRAEIESANGMRPPGRRRREAPAPAPTRPPTQRESSPRRAPARARRGLSRSGAPRAGPPRRPPLRGRDRRLPPGSALLSPAAVPRGARCSRVRLLAPSARAHRPSRPARRSAAVGGDAPVRIRGRGRPPRGNRPRRARSRRNPPRAPARSETRRAPVRRAPRLRRPPGGARTTRRGRPTPRLESIVPRVLERQRGSQDRLRIARDGTPTCSARGFAPLAGEGANRAPATGFSIDPMEPGLDGFPPPLIRSREQYISPQGKFGRPPRKLSAHPCPPRNASGVAARSGSRLSP